MKIITKTLAIALSLFFAGSVIAGQTKLTEWLFLHTAATAEMTSENTLVMPFTNGILQTKSRNDQITINIQEFVSFWDEGRGDSFKADPPNAILTWVEGGALGEAAVVITDAAPAEHGRFIKYTVEVVAGAAPQIGYKEGRRFNMMIVNCRATFADNNMQKVAVCICTLQC